MRLGSGSKLAWMAVNSVLVYDVRMCFMDVLRCIYDEPEEIEYQKNCILVPGFQSKNGRVKRVGKLKYL